MRFGTHQKAWERSLVLRDHEGNSQIPYENCLSHAGRR